MCCIYSQIQTNKQKDMNLRGILSGWEGPAEVGNGDRRGWWDDK
jgi:hypothetical protein